MKISKHKTTSQLIAEYLDSGKKIRKMPNIKQSLARDNLMTTIYRLGL